MSDSQLLNELIDSLRCLPGVGKKTAQRIAYHLLQRNRDGARNLAKSLLAAMDHVDYCQRCRNFSEQSICELCRSPKRDASLLCIVESSADVFAIEAVGFNGLYFVLSGHLSPLDGIGPDDLGIDKLAILLDEGKILEVILATNSTVEGEATAYYLGEMIRKRSIRVTRIAHGVPMGGELEYVDSNTLSHALAGRRDL